VLQPLKVNMPNEIVADIDGFLSNKSDGDEHLRGIFTAARNYVQAEISDLLGDFRSKRSLGEFNVFTAQCYASAVLAMALCPSVCLSITSRSSTKTAKRRITQTTSHDSSGTLVF